MKTVAPIHLVATREGPLDRWRGGPWGMNHPTAYTPLESLFLFQSLLTHGVDNGSFVRISELLRGNALIKSGDSYDPARLSPDALQHLFLALLRDELRSEAERADGNGNGNSGGGGGGGSGDGSLSPGSRKRKLGSPSLPTLKDVYENVDKIPILVNRLYARYREHMVKLIREDERKFATVQKEIQILERSERERLARAAANQNGSPALTPGKAPATPNGPAGATPGGIRRGPTPNTPILPPKPPTPSIAAPKVAPPSHLATATPPRPSASPKPPNGASSVLQAPAGAPTTPGPRVLQPPSQPPKQAISSRPEVASPHPQPTAGTSQAGSAAAGNLKWEKPYQPPAHAPQAGQFMPPTVAPQSAPQQQKTQQQQQQQQQQQWQQQQQPHTQHLPQQLHQPHQPQHHTQYPPQPQGQAAHPPQPQNRPPSTKPVLVPPQTQPGQLVAPLQPGPPRPVGPGVPQQVRPPSTTPTTSTPGRPIQPQHQPPPHIQQNQQPLQGQQPHPQQQQQGFKLAQPQQSLLARKFQPSPKVQPTRPIASAASTPAKGTPGPVIASPAPSKATPGSITQQKWQPGGPSQQGQQATPSASPAPQAPTKDNKSYSSPYVPQIPRPAIPEHMIRQAAATTPGPVRRLSPASPAPRTPAPSSPSSLKRGFGTKWASHSTPSTPGPILSEPESPAYEPVSPPQRAAPSQPLTTNSVPKLQVPKPPSKAEATPPVKTPRGRPPRAMQKGRGSSTTPSVNTRRSQSITSQADELSIDHSMTTTKVKKEVATPRLREETGDTTADESVQGRGHMATPSMSRASKRKRQETPADLSGPPTHVLWTRGFTKVSSSALDQISSHRDANMFATALRERDAPYYRQIVLQPQDITSIRSAIKAGNKAALQAAASLPGGDPGTASVWLPISEDLVPPKGIINSAHLERELVHMFCNAIMYNPDPHRGPGQAFMKRSQSDEEEVVGYRLDENGIVKNTQSMFLEVEKLLGDLRAAEKDRGIPPISTTRQGSVATPADDTAEEEDELAGDGDSASVSGTAKRRRISTRG